jgi:tripartite-type tricarboxylate transporter receptor subunit TctC
MILTELLSEVPYRIRDFHHIFGWVRESSILVARPGKWKDITAFLAEGRRRRLTASIPYLTSAGRLSGILLAKETGLRCRWVPFGGSNGAMAALLGGHVDFSVPVTASSLPAVRAGEFVPLLLFAESRDPHYPDVPTPAELGLRMPALPVIRGLAAPPGAGAGPLGVLERACEEAIRDPEFLAHARKTSLPVFPLSSIEYRKAIESCYSVVDPLRELMIEDARQ